MDQLDSVCPIFLEQAGKRFCQIGSGVIIEFRGEVFLLTAAHVIDQLENGTLLMPAENNKIVPIEGSYACNKPEGNREDYFLDYGYFKLDKTFSDSISEKFYTVKENEVGIEKDYTDQSIFSFVGYPYRKSNVSGGTASTTPFYYGTYHADLQEYEELGYSSDVNIIAKYNRKKSVNTKSGQIQLSVLPHGISGGGVFVWPNDSFEIPRANRKLVGIAHEFKKEGYFVGTRLEIFLEAILRNIQLTS